MARIWTVFALPVGTGKAPLIEKSEDEVGHSREVAVASSAQDKFSDRLNRQLVRRPSFRTSGSASRSRASGKSHLISIHDSDDDDVSEESQPPASLSPGMDEETVAVIRKRRRSSEGSLPSPSRPRFVPEGDGSSFAVQSDLISLAGRMRSAGCRLPSLASSVEKEAYAKVAVVNSKVRFSFIFFSRNHFVVFAYLDFFSGYGGFQ